MDDTPPLAVRLARALTKRVRSRQRPVDPEQCPERHRPTAHAADDGTGVLKKFFGTPRADRELYDPATARRCKICNDVHLWVMVETVTFRDAAGEWESVSSSEYDRLKAEGLLPPMDY